MERANKKASADDNRQPLDETSAGPSHSRLSAGERGRLIRSPTEHVMDRAEKETDRRKDDIQDEETRAADRTISTTRSPSAERGEPGGFTLPVVEEAAEDKSTGGRSKDGDCH